MLRYTKFIAGALLCGGVFFFPPSVHAQAVEAMTEDNVREFIEKTAQVTSGREEEMTDNEINIYLDVHIHPLAKFKSLMRYNVPGFDIQQTSMNLDKEGFIESVHKATQSVSDYDNQMEISDIKIENDGKKATVKTRMREEGKMPVSDQIEQENVPMEGMSTCTQILILSDEHAIQMYNASCVTDIQFQTFEP